MEPAANEQVPWAIPATARLLGPSPESPDDASDADLFNDIADARHAEQMSPFPMQQTHAAEVGDSDTPELEPETVEPETEEARACDVAPAATDSGKDQELLSERRPPSVRRQRSSLCDRLHAEHAEKLRKRQQQRDAIARKADEEFQELQNRLARRRHTSPATLRLRDKIIGKSSRRPSHNAFAFKTDVESHPDTDRQAETRDTEVTELEGRETSTSDGEALSQASRVVRPRAKVLLYRREPEGPCGDQGSDGNGRAEDADLDKVSFHSSERKSLRRASSCPPSL
mmetsp:Transcript_125204/g.229733  ORF Transcript_125204/g.229733 Transcript_125204/m.229733 type:complete len:285 (+) Transcript_125204:105-959(+)